MLSWVQRLKQRGKWKSEFDSISSVHIDGSSFPLFSLTLMITPVCLLSFSPSSSVHFSCLVYSYLPSFLCSCLQSTLVPCTTPPRDVRPLTTFPLSIPLPLTPFPFYTLPTTNGLNPSLFLLSFSSSENKHKHLPFIDFRGVS